MVNMYYLYNIFFVAGKISWIKWSYYYVLEVSNATKCVGQPTQNALANQL